MCIYKSLARQFAYGGSGTLQLFRHKRGRLRQWGIFSGAKELWTSFQKNVADYINKAGGDATIGPSLIKQVSNDEIKWD